MSMNLRDYLGIPYVPGGQGRDGADCWGFFRLVQREVYGVDVPPVGIHPDDLRGLLAAFGAPDHPARAAWMQIDPDEAASGDGLLFARRAGHPDHVGIALGDGRVLHCARGIGSVAEPIGRLFSRQWRHVTAWRHVGASRGGAA